MFSLRFGSSKSGYVTICTDVIGRGCQVALWAPVNILATHRGQMPMRPRRLRPWLTISDGHLGCTGRWKGHLNGCYLPQVTWHVRFCGSPLTAEHTRCFGLWVRWPAPQVVATWMWLQVVATWMWLQVVATWMWLQVVATWMWLYCTTYHESRDLHSFCSPPVTKVPDTWCHVFSSHHRMAPVLWSQDSRLFPQV